MNFAKIAEARAVKKIILMIRAEAAWRNVPDSPDTYLYAADVLDRVADAIEAGEWKDVVLPKRKADIVLPKPAKKAKK